jgi:hypothetical protein
MVTIRASLPGRSAGQAGETPHHPAPAGIVGGTVLRASRLSGSVSEASLAAACGISENEIRSWEDGSYPLASVPVPLIARLETALRTVGGEPGLIEDLFAAAWCDLVILAATHFEDATCLLADPVAASYAFRELLGWSLTGCVPPRYRPYATPGPLLGNAALIERAVHVLDAMQAGLTWADLAC